MSQADNTANPYLVTTEPFYQANGNEVQLYEAAYQARLPVMLKGPTGCGKSRFAVMSSWQTIDNGGLQRGHDGL